MTLTAPDTDLITHAVALASRAPSLHNSQPWRWRYDKTGLNLYADPSRLVSATDPAGRELLLSCGAVLNHLEAALSGIGYKALVERFPDPNNSRFLAHIEFAHVTFVTDAQKARREAIRDRYSDRLPLESPTGWDAFETILRQTLRDDVELTVLPETARAGLEEASQLVEGMRRYDSRYHAELHWWAGHTVNSTGVPRELLPSPDESERVGVGRTFPRQEQQQGRRADVAEDKAVVVVLSTDTDTPRDLLRCGEALSTVLLEATMANYATCTLTHVVEHPSSRAIIQKMVGGDRKPQVLVRIGDAPATGLPLVQTPRRDVHDTLEIRI
ncbi:MAG: hypothetical protein LLG14_22420 [Nocardiaceae bacterium]|nr:hypothetical protein [Nocardiaceae bacterium]